MKDECDQCGKITLVQKCTWKFDHEEGLITVCANCFESLISSGYKLERQ